MTAFSIRFASPLGLRFVVFFAAISVPLRVVKGVSPRKSIIGMGGMRKLARVIHTVKLWPAPSAQDRSNGIQNRFGIFIGRFCRALLFQILDSLTGIKG
jgi:hypothetical protein